MSTATEARTFRDSPTSEVQRRPDRLRLTRRRRSDIAVFLLFAGINVVLIGVFSWRPVIENIRYSFLNWTLGNDRATSIGLENYIEFFTTDADTVMRTTVVFTAVTVGGSLVLGLLLGLVLNKRIAGTKAARAATFAPYVLSGVGIGLVWTFVFDPVVGVFSIIQQSLGLPVTQWFLDPGLSLAMICIVFVWKNLGYCAVIYLAGLQSVPRDVLDAAAIDGADAWRRFWRITFPLLSPTTFFLLVTTMLSSLQAFDIIKTMTPQSPGTRTLMYEAYVQAFGGYNRAGYSAALSTLLFLILIVVTVAQMLFLQRRVHYS